jgi:hypothetical protein
MWHRRTKPAGTVVHYLVLGCIWLGWSTSLPADLYRFDITRDTYIDSDSEGGRDYNYGAHDRLRAVANSADRGGSRTRILLALDIPAAIWSLPVSQIESAKLYLYCYGNSPGDHRPLSLYPLLRPFEEGSGTGKNDDHGYSGATWATWNGSDPWTTPGGDCDWSEYVDGVAGGLDWWTWDLKPLWENPGLAAYGALLAVRPEEGVESGHISGTFRSSDYTFDVNLRPFVELSIVPEPTSCVLFLTAGVLMGGGALLRRRHRRAKPE